MKRLKMLFLALGILAAVPYNDLFAQKSQPMSTDQPADQATQGKATKKKQKKTNKKMGRMNMGDKNVNHGNMDHDKMQPPK